MNKGHGKTKASKKRNDITNDSRVRELSPYEKKCAEKRARNEQVMRELELQHGIVNGACEWKPGMKDSKVGDEEDIKEVIGHHVAWKRVFLHVRWTEGGVYWYVTLSTLLKDHPKMVADYISKNKLWNGLSKAEQKALKNAKVFDETEKCGKNLFYFCYTVCDFQWALENCSYSRQKIL